MPKAASPHHAAPFTPIASIVEWASLADLKPAIFNDRVYRPITPDDPGVRTLAAEVAALGLLEPIVVTRDNVILSGHRRRAACELAGLTEVQVRRCPIWSTDPRFPQILVSFNSQREKTTNEKVLEAVVKVNPADAHAQLKCYRRQEADRVNGRVSDAGLSLIATTKARPRSQITVAKRPVIDAVIRVLEGLKFYWPVTLRCCVEDI